MRAVRMASVDEVQFLLCIKHEVWGSNAARFKHWAVGDYLIFVVEKAIAGVAEVTGETFQSEEAIWENGVFPHRVPIRFLYALGPEIRPPIYGDVWDAVTSAWGTRYGWGLATQSSLPDDAAQIILEAIQMRPNELEVIRAHLDAYFNQARQWRTHQQMKMVTPKPLVKPRKSPARQSSSTSDSAHTKAQSELIRLGKTTGCAVWVATNDRSRVYGGRPLGEGCLKVFPNLGLTPEVRDHISLIDVIWIRRNMPVYAFEVEMTSTVYSGLLRMSDLVALVPLLNIKLFIVAPEARREKVLRELSRPTFQKIGLAAYCRFVAAEDLEVLLTKVETLGGHIQPSVLETVAVELEEKLESSLG